MNQKQVKERLDHLKKVCKEAGMRVTHQRLEIFREVANTGDHPNAEMVFQGVRKRLPTVSLDTVYRTLWLLVDLGLITTMTPGRKRARFDANLEEHHHFVCVKCGFTRDFYNEDFNALNLPENAKAFGKAQNTHVEVHGLCNACNENK